MFVLPAQHVDSSHCQKRRNIQCNPYYPVFPEWLTHTHKQRCLFRTVSPARWQERTQRAEEAYAHHEQVRLVHVLQEVAGVGGHGAGPRTPQQGEQPTLINHPQVDCYIGIPQSPVSAITVGLWLGLICVCMCVFLFVIIRVPKVQWNNYIIYFFFFLLKTTLLFF